MKRLRSIILDDETSAVHTLRGMLEELCPFVVINAVANNIEQGVKAVKQYNPDIVFLDIEMPPSGSGFDFLREVEDETFGVIFTTAYAHYAIQAINDAQPWGFLVKPYRAKELVHTMYVATRMRHRLLSSPQYGNRGIILSDHRKGNVVVKFNEIYYCQADGPCTTFYLNREDKIEKLSVYKTLKDIENELPDSLFCRTHHSYLVNMNYILRYERHGRAGAAYLPNGAHVEISGSKMETFVPHFNNYLHGYPLT